MRGLEGIKVVELTSYVAAPACPRILGEMGATIFKIEPASGDEYRTNGPGFGMEKTDTDDPFTDYPTMHTVEAGNNSNKRLFVYLCIAEIAGTEYIPS